MTKDGLPSSYVYRTLEDEKGFLWVATNAGVARFDGKYFQIFTTRDGLPENEVFSFVKEPNGRIWVECFNQVPAYFDEVQNRFIIPALNPKTADEMTNTLDISLSALPKEGISYFNRDKYVVFKNAKSELPCPIAENLPAVNIIDEYADESTLVTSGIPNDELWKQYQLKFYHIKGKKILDTIRPIQDMSAAF